MSAKETAAAVRSLYGSQNRCLSPFKIYRPGEHRDKNPNTGRVERQEVPCGYCKVCIATRKSNWVGRLVAEAAVSASVAFLTLTYAEEPTEFVYRDVQLFLKRYREHQARERGCKVRFFCSGERGTKRGRIHWHIVLFFDKETTVRQPRRRKLWSFWPHGWTHVKNLQPHDRLAAMRYVAKYCVKDAGGEKEVFMRCSLKPGIGAFFFDDLAERTAKSGLAAKGGYFHGGVVYKRGPREGQHVEFRLTGAMARRFCDRYSRAWEKYNPDAREPVTPFTKTFQENYVTPKSSARLRDVYTGIVREKPLAEFRREKPKHDCSGLFMIHVGRDVACLSVAPDGSAKVDVDGVDYYVFRSIKDALRIDDEDALAIDKWLRQQRGANWLMRECNEHYQKAYATFEAESEAQRRREFDVYAEDVAKYATAFYAAE